MGRCPRVVVYEYAAWTGYLLPVCIPEALPLAVRLGESAREVVARVDPACTLFMFHINLTLSSRIPLDRDALVQMLRARGIAVRNASLSNISKRVVHKICTRANVPSARANPNGDPDELLMVKTNYNYHGARECELRVEQLLMLGYESPHDLPQRRETIYRIVARREVPVPLWTSPHWVVERYITNDVHRFHRVYMAGDAMVVSRVFDPSTFKKMPEGIERESYYVSVSDPVSAPAVPEDVKRVAQLAARIAKAGQVDYAAFDIASDNDGGYFMIDINTTPYWGDGGHPELLRYLGAGLLGDLHVR